MVAGDLDAYETAEALLYDVCDYESQVSTLVMILRTLLVTTSANGSVYVC